jgi:pimeloyl-ACP methyl ester carboxylesterase
MLITLLAAGCADDDSGDDSRPSASDRGPTSTERPPPSDTTTLSTIDPPLPVEWEPCGEVECATLTVPLDYEDAGGETIELALARRPADDPDARIGSLLFNPGGPGVPGVELVRAGAIDFPSEVLDRFDIVSWDTRGVGESAPLSCGSLDTEYITADATPDDEAEEAAFQGLSEEVADECAAQDGDLIPFMGTTQTVDDLERIRQALGDDQLTYVGYSYGTLIGELYADRYPERVRALVLDGVVDPSLDLAETARRQAEGLEGSLDDIFAACTDDEDCPVDDPAATFDAVEATLESGAGGETGPADLQLAAVLATYDTRFWPDFHAALADAAAGDYAAIEALAQSYAGIGPYSPYAAIICVDSPSPADFEAFDDLATEIEASAPRLGGAVGFEFLPCAYWAAEPTREPEAVDAEGASPILVVGNTGDAATPYRQAEAVAEFLDSGVLLTLEGEGHTSGGDPCIDEWVATYVVDLELPPEGTVC